MKAYRPCVSVPRGGLAAVRQVIASFFDSSATSAPEGGFPDECTLSCQSRPMRTRPIHSGAVRRQAPGAQAQAGADPLRSCSPPTRAWATGPSPRRYIPKIDVEYVARMGMCSTSVPQRLTGSGRWCVSTKARPNSPAGLNQRAKLAGPSLLATTKAPGLTSPGVRRSAVQSCE